MNNGPGLIILFVVVGDLILLGVGLYLIYRFMKAQYHKDQQTKAEKVLIEAREKAKSIELEARDKSLKEMKELDEETSRLKIRLADGELTQTIDYSEPVVLPGLTPGQLDEVFKRQKFTCSPVEIGISGFYQGQCSLDEADSLRELYHFGRTEKDIDLIDANFTHKGQGNDRQAAEYFKSIVTRLGFSPNNQAEVLQWIDMTLPQIIEDRDIQEATFGGVRYRLYGAAQNRSMEIGYLP